jgi:transcriptional antiterminator RfaH
LEPFLHPEGLFTNSGVGEENSFLWWVLHTKPRTEKTLARRFLDRDLSFFLPLYQREWRSKGRLLRSHLPLFPGYIFLRGNEEARLHALETNLVARWLPVTDQQRLHLDLARVHRLITSDAPLTPEERLLPGTPVEITRGPLVGLEGVVIRRGKQLKVFVEVQFLQRGVSVEIESWMIQPISA